MRKRRDVKSVKNGIRDAVPISWGSACDGVLLSKSVASIDVNVASKESPVGHTKTCQANLFRLLYEELQVFV